MFGPIDIDSLDFQARAQIMQVAEPTGEARSQVIARAISECYRRTIGAATDEELARRHRPWPGVANSSTPSARTHLTICGIAMGAGRILAANTRLAPGIPFAWDAGMPEISRFYGITIQMFSERGDRHHPPHFHAIYGEWRVSIAIDSLAVLRGRLPLAQRRLVEAWAEIHRAELRANWDLLNSGQSAFKIEPLS